MPSANDKSSDIYKNRRTTPCPAYNSYTYHAGKNTTCGVKRNATQAKLKAQDMRNVRRFIEGVHREDLDELCQWAASDSDDPAAFPDMNWAAQVLDAPVRETRPPVRITEPWEARRSRVAVQRSRFAAIRRQQAAFECRISYVADWVQAQQITMASAATERPQEPESTHSELQNITDWLEEHKNDPELDEQNIPAPAATSTAVESHAVESGSDTVIGSDDACYPMYSLFPECDIPELQNLDNDAVNFIISETKACAGAHVSMHLGITYHFNE